MQIERSGWSPEPAPVRGSRAVHASQRLEEDLVPVQALAPEQQAQHIAYYNQVLGDIGRLRQLPNA
ncbi:MAG: hypothetical protein AB1758_00175 [Candidatus Eremiobacterota bacterium]